MSRTIFKRLEDVYKAILIALREEESNKKEYKDKERIELLIKQKDLLNEIFDYLNSFVWLKQADTIERIKFFLKNKYNYEEYCNHFDVSYEAAKVSVSYANQKAIEKVGKNTIDLIIEGKLDEARATFYFRSGQLKLRNFIVDAALVHIPESEYMTVDIKDCKRELTFLRLYSQALLEGRVDLIDKDKLAYLRYILEGDNPRLAEERLHLMNLLKGETTVNEYLEEAEDRILY